MSATRGVPRVSIIVPVLNEADSVGALLTALQAWRAAGDEVVVVDGGSSDDTLARSAALADRLLSTARGRATQLNAGAAAATGEVLWFVHADTRIDALARDSLLGALARGAGWGRFDVRIEDRSWVFRVIESSMNLRSRVTGIATGDQTLFVTRGLFAEVGGYPDLALMEDIELAGALKRLQAPCCLRARVGTSARRWRRHGIVRTIVLMWSLRLAWFCGVPAARLARWYGYR